MFVNPLDEPSPVIFINWRNEMFATFIVIFLVLLCCVAGMAVGVMFGRPPLKGSCGGLGAVGVEKVCGCSHGCAKQDQ